MLSRDLEKSLHRALALAVERRHEFATLEHLLYALLEDADAIAVLKACGVDLERLERELETFIDEELESLATDEAVEAKPTTGFQRVVQRAVLHVQSSGRSEVTGANILVAIFSERESHAVYFLQEQDMSRYDAVNYISHRIAKVAGPIGAGRQRLRHRRGRPRGEHRQGRAGGARRLLRQPERKGQRRADRPAHRPRCGDRAHHPGALPAHQEQPALCRRCGRGQDGARRRAGPADRERRGAAGARRRHDLRAGHGRAARRHALSRRLRGADQGGARRDRGARERDPLHRRDPHGDRRGRHQRRRHGCLELAEARTAERHAALHRVDHLQGIPKLLREGPRAGAALPEDRRERAERRRGGEDPARAQALLRGAPRRALHGGGDPHRRRACEPLHQRPPAPRQGHRRDRRGRRLAAPAAGIEAAEDGRRKGRRGRGGEDRPHPAQEREPGRQDHPGEPGARSEDRCFRPGRGNRRGGDRDQDVAGWPARARQAGRLLPLQRADGRRQDRGRAPARPRDGAWSSCAST